MTSKKLTIYQVYVIEFFSNFNFFISYTLDKNNEKADLLMCCPNNLSLNKNNDC